MRAFYEMMDCVLKIFWSNGITFPEHLHREVEVIWVEEGVLDVVIGDCRQSLGAGELGIIFPNTIHSYAAQGDCRSCLLIFGTELISEYEGILTHKHCPRPFLDAGRVHRDVLLCLERLGAPALRDKLPLLKAYVTVLFGNLLPELELVQMPVKKAAQLSDGILKYVMEHYRHDISLSKISAELGVNKYTVSRFFNQELGCGFNEYLNTLRIGYAQHLLGNSRISVTETAMEAGFNSLRSFNRVFRAIHGVSPREYRKRVIEDNK